MKMESGKPQDFAWPVTALEADDAYALMKALNLWKHGVHKERKLIIFGAGIRGSVFHRLCGHIDIDVYAFADNNPQKWGGTMAGVSILSPSMLWKIKDECIIVISVENGDVIERQLENEGFLKDKTYFSIQSQVYDRYIDEFKRKLNLKTLILGDCGLSQIGLEDIDIEKLTGKNQSDFFEQVSQIKSKNKEVNSEKTKNLETLLRNTLGKDTTKVLAVHGLGMGGYYHVIKGQIDWGLCPKQIGLMINFEVFTGKHHMLPRTQHAPLFEKLSSIVCEEDLRDYAQLTKKRFENLKSDVFSQLGSGQNPALVFRMNYMYRLKKDTEDMVYLFRIFNFCRQKNIRVVPYIPPVNYMYAKELLGEKFLKAYNVNVKTMKMWIQNQGIEVLDLSYVLEPSEFASLKTIDETANYRGRKKLLSILSEKFS